MSENNPSGNTDGAGGASSESTDQKTVAYESYSKLLGQKKKRDSENEALLAKLADYEQAKLEAEGNLKLALDNQKKLTEESKKQFNELFNHVTNKVLKQKVYSEVEKNGGVDPDTVYKIMDFEGVEFTKEFDLVDESVLTKKIQEIAKVKPFLFKKDVKAPNDLTPNNSVNSSTSKAVSEMSREELSKALHAANASEQTT